ncbi:MAG TPA: UbiA prenyltransferase family protein, partial [Bacillota bacterium]|nr:UbiA prenyltransferase family protein [Bacillota bacterium]
NDIWDRQSDLAHPRKKYRPIASGVITIPQAVGIMLVLAGSLIAVQIGMGYFNKIVFIYIVLNIFYSFWLKKIPIVDLMIIASCYLLRLSAGLEALESNVSYWILVAIFFVTLSIIACKRRSEKMRVGEASAHRRVLGYYNVEFLNYTILIAAIGAINAYVLFVHDLCEKPKSDQLVVYSIPLILFGILKYLHTIFTENKGDDPVEIILKDYSLMAVSITCLVFLVRYSI